MKLHLQILEDWFGKTAADLPAKKKLWFGKSEQTDAWLTERYAEHLDRALAGEYDAWQLDPKGAVALVVLLDQFSRNVHRDTPQMYAYDAKALEVARRVVDRGVDRTLPDYPRSFVYMPFMHSESRFDQGACVFLFQILVDDADEGNKKAFENNLEYAYKHWEIVDAFGRFPHRNAILGRASTEQELEFLQQPGSSF